MTGSDRETRRPESTRRNIVSAIFHDASDAEDAYAEAREMGYGDDEINVLMSEQAREEYFPEERVEHEKERKTAAGAGVGGSIGLAVGAIAGAIAAVGTSVALPGLGLVVVGPLAGALAGAGAGGATGTLIGALAGAGMTEERATLYRTAIEEGGVVLAVHPRSEEDAEEIEERWEDAGGDEIFRSE